MGGGSNIVGGETLQEEISWGRSQGKDITGGKVDGITEGVEGSGTL